MVGDNHMWWNFLNNFNWGTLVYIIIPAIVASLAVIGLITVIKWIF